MSDSSTDANIAGQALPPELIDFDPAWLNVVRTVHKTYGSKPDLNALLMLIGVQETGITDLAFTKEQKQDLMHVAVCHLLQQKGYYRFEGRDEEGWPHYACIAELPPMTVQEQDVLLKRCVINYFQNA